MKKISLTFIAITVVITLVWFIMVVKNKDIPAAIESSLEDVIEREGYFPMANDSVYTDEMPEKKISSIKEDNCQQNQEPPGSIRRVSPSIEDQAYVDRAVALIGKNFDGVPHDIAPHIIRSEKNTGFAQVSWMIPKSKSSTPNRPGPDYYYRVIFNDDDPNFKPLILVGR